MPFVGDFVEVANIFLFAVVDGIVAFEFGITVQCI